MAAALRPTCVYPMGVVGVRVLVRHTHPLAMTTSVSTTTTKCFPGSSCWKGRRHMSVDTTWNEKKRGFIGVDTTWNEKKGNQKKRTWNNSFFYTENGEICYWNNRFFYTEDREICYLYRYTRSIFVLWILTEYVFCFCFVFYEGVNKYFFCFFFSFLVGGSCKYW